jgi:hypothetical protein
MPQELTTYRVVATKHFAFAVRVANLSPSSAKYPPQSIPTVFATLGPGRGLDCGFTGRDTSESEEVRFRQVASRWDCGFQPLSGVCPVGETGRIRTRTDMFALRRPSGLGIVIRTRTLPGLSRIACLLIQSTLVATA